MRAVTNMIGNVVATLVIARWEQKLDLAQAREQLRLGPEKIIMSVDSPTEEPLSETQIDRSTMQ